MWIEQKTTWDTHSEKKWIHSSLEEKKELDEIWDLKTTEKHLHGIYIQNKISEEKNKIVMSQLTNTLEKISPLWEIVDYILLFGEQLIGMIDDIESAILQEISTFKTLADLDYDNWGLFDKTNLWSYIWNPIRNKQRSAFKKAIDEKVTILQHNIYTVKKSLGNIISACKTSRKQDRSSGQEKKMKTLLIQNIQPEIEKITSIISTIQGQDSWLWLDQYSWYEISDIEKVRIQEKYDQMTKKIQENVGEITSKQLWYDYEIISEILKAFQLYAPMMDLWYNDIQSPPEIFQSIQNFWIQNMSKTMWWIIASISA